MSALRIALAHCKVSLRGTTSIRLATWSSIKKLHLAYMQNSVNANALKHVQFVEFAGFQLCFILVSLLVWNRIDEHTRVDAVGA